MAPLLPGGKVAAGRRQEGLIALLLLRSGRGRKGRGRGEGTASMEQKFTLTHSANEEGRNAPSLFLKEDAVERGRMRERERNSAIHLQLSGYR